MATTEQSGGAQRDQQPIVRRHVKSLAELIERFHDPQTSLEECHGLLSWLAHRYGVGSRHLREVTEVVTFLTGIGNERKPLHPLVAQYEDLRARARIVLARNIAPLHLTVWTCDLGAIYGSLAEFYAAHEAHADLNERDRVNVHAFLEREIEMQHVHHDVLVHALVTTGAWKAILEHRFFEAIPWLCKRLALALGRPEPVLTDRFWRPVLSGEDPDDLADCIVQAGLSKDDLIVFSEEIRRIVALCGMAIGHRPDGDDDAEREAAKTLLVLVSRVNYAVCDLRG